MPINTPSMVVSLNERSAPTISRARPDSHPRIETLDVFDQGHRVLNQAVVVLGHDERDLARLILRGVASIDLHVAERGVFRGLHHRALHGVGPGLAENHQSDAEGKGADGEGRPSPVPREIPEGQAEDEGGGPA
jgi:hypothetical protein